MFGVHRSNRHCRLLLLLCIGFFLAVVLVAAVEMDAADSVPKQPAVGGSADKTTTARSLPEIRRIVRKQLRAQQQQAMDASTPPFIPPREVPLHEQLSAWAVQANRVVEAGFDLFERVGRDGVVPVLRAFSHYTGTSGTNAYGTAGGGAPDAPMRAMHEAALPLQSRRSTSSSGEAATAAGAQLADSRAGVSTEARRGSPGSASRTGRAASVPVSRRGTDPRRALRAGAAQEAAVREGRDAAFVATAERMLGLGSDGAMIDDDVAADEADDAVVSYRPGWRNRNRDTDGFGRRSRRASSDDDARRPAITSMGSVVSDSLFSLEGPEDDEAIPEVQHEGDARDARAVAVAPVRTTLSTRYNTAWSDFCVGGVTALPYDPAINFTCWTDAVSYRIVGVDEWMTLSVAQQLWCSVVPASVANTSQRVCICPRDGYAASDIYTNVVQCYQRGATCQSSVTNPAGFLECSSASSKQVKTATGIPVCAWIDRHDATLNISMQVNCSNKDVLTNDELSLYGLTNAEYNATVAARTVQLLAVQCMGRSCTTNSFYGAGVPAVADMIGVGNYSMLQNYRFSYLGYVADPQLATSVDREPTAAQLLTPDAPITPGPTAATAFAVSIDGMFGRNAVLYVRPYNFIHLSDALGANGSRALWGEATVPPRGRAGLANATTTSIDTLTAANNRSAAAFLSPTPLFNAGTTLNFSLPPQALTDEYFTGGRLVVEVGVRAYYPYAATFAAAIMTFDVTNPPPPLPDIIESGLSGGAIAGIVVGVLVAVGAVVGGVGYYRYRQLQAAAAQRRAENRELRRLLQGLPPAG